MGKDIINKGVLSEDQLADVNGGARALADGGSNPNLAGGVQRHFCKKCNKDTVHKVFSGTRMVCTECGTVPML